MNNNTYWVYVDKDGEPYKSPMKGKVNLLSERPNAMRKYQAKQYSEGVVTGFKKVKIVEVGNENTTD